MRLGVNVLAGRLLTEYAGWIRYQQSIPPYHAIYGMFIYSTYILYILHIYIFKFHISTIYIPYIPYSMVLGSDRRIAAISFHIHQ